MAISLYDIAQQTLPTTLVPDQKATGSASTDVAPAATAAAPTSFSAAAAPPPAATSASAAPGDAASPATAATTTPPSVVAPQASAFTQAYDESKGVAGRVASISDSGSPLMQIAQTRGNQQAAARGLTASSIGVESAQKAVLDAATPIATADASLYGQQQLANQSAKNTAELANLNAATSVQMQGNDLAQRRKELDQQESQFARSLGLSTDQLRLQRDSLTQNQQQFLQGLDLQRQQLQQQQSQFESSLGANQTNFQAQLAQQKVMAQLDADTRLQLGQLDAASRKDMQGSVNLTNAWQTMVQSISNIQNNPNLDEGAKHTLIQNQMDSFKSFSTFWQKTSGIDVSDLLNLTVGAAPPAPAPAPAPPPYPGGDGGSSGEGGSSQ